MFPKPGIFATAHREMLVGKSKKWFAEFAPLCEMEHDIVIDGLCVRHVGIFVAMGMDDRGLCCQRRGGIWRHRLRERGGLREMAGWFFILEVCVGEVCGLGQVKRD